MRRVERPFLTGWAALLALAPVSGTARAQEMPPPQMMQMQARRIAQERPPEAEAGAREFLRRIAPERAASLDTLKSRSVEAYWQEIGQLMVQREMTRGVTQRDTTRGRLMERMFATEAEARGLQRAYREGPEPDRRRIRGELERIISRHFDVEEELRALEIADAERRLAAVRAEAEKRRQRRDEFVRWAVDDIIRDAERPQ